MTVGFDKMSVNQELLMSLPFREGTGAITQDYAKPLREVDLINAPAWTTIASGLGVLAFDGGVSDQYLECPGVETADLDFTGDYSIVAWVNWKDTTQSEIVVGRYETEVDGWDIYLTSTHIDTLSQRHHHSSLAQTTDNCYSVGWTPDTGNWYLIGVTRSGLYPLHYRNGVPLTMSYSAFGFRDPDACNQDLVIGTRGVTKANNFYKGDMQGVRTLGRALSARDHMNVYQLEKHWFGTP